MTQPIQTRRVALITGAARRVGATIARTLHAAGFDLALHCRHSRSELDRLIDDLEHVRPNSTLALQADLADLDRLPSLVEQTIAAFGRLDALVNNASAFYATPIGTITAQQWDDLFASNARAPLFLCQAAAAQLRKQHGAIVNLIDIYAERPLPAYSVYCMAKAAQAAMTMALARELGPDIRVNGVAPGAVMWPDDGNSTSAQTEIIERTPLRRAGAPDDVAGAVLWLLRDATFVTGQILRIDGGRSLAI